MARDVSEETKANWRRLLAGLRNATNAQKINWDRTAVESLFIASLGNHIILLEKQELQKSTKYVVKLQDIEGDLIDEFNDTDIEEDVFDNRQFQILENLHLKIRRQISGAETALSEVLAELDKLDEIPF